MIDATVDEGGKLAQPETFSLRPKKISHGDIKLETPGSAKLPFRGEATSSSYSHQTKAGSYDQVNHPSPSTSLQDPLAISARYIQHYQYQADSTSLDPFLSTPELIQAFDQCYRPSAHSQGNGSGQERAYWEPRESSSRLQSVQEGMSICGQDVGLRGGQARCSKAGGVGPMVKKEEEEVDRSLDGSANAGGGITESKDREMSGMRGIHGLYQHDQVKTISRHQHLGQQGEYTKHHTAQRPPRSTPRLVPKTSPFVSTLNYPCSAKTTARRPPSTFSEIKQEWTIDLLVFCSERDQGLGRKDDEVLGFPT
jgi:hypothetical protein